MIAYITWFMLPSLAKQVTKRKVAIQEFLSPYSPALEEPLTDENPTVSPSGFLSQNTKVGTMQSIHQVEENIDLTPQEIEIFAAEIKALQSWEKVKKRYENDDNEMFKRIKYRNEYVVLPTLQKIKDEEGLRITVPDIDNIPGSRTTTSDFDVTIEVPTLKYSERNETSVKEWLDHLGDDVKAARSFVQRINAQFGGFPGVLFDSNVYVRGLSSDLFRPSSRYTKEIQDAAALTKIRRYATEEEWQTIVQGVRIVAMAETGRLATPQNGTPYAKVLLRNFHMASNMTIENRISLVQKLAELERKKGNKTREKTIQEVVKSSDDGLIDAFLRSTDPNLASEAEYTLYLERMALARQTEVELERIRIQPPENTTISQWNKNKEELRVKVKKQIASSMYFAPEAYSSEGAFMHVVKYEQAKEERSPRERHVFRGKQSVVRKNIAVFESKTHASMKNRRFASLTTFDLLCSMNEQAGDFFKDVHVHYATDRVKALVQSSKYLTRFFDAIDLMNKKAFQGSEPTITQHWTSVNVTAIRAFIEPLLRIRKTSLQESQKKTKAEEYVKQQEVHDTLGTNVDSIAAMVVQYVAWVNGKYRSLYDLSLFTSDAPSSAGRSTKNHGTASGAKI